jgi:PIN domain
MPIWTDAELQLAIESNRIGAVSLDTSIFDGSDCNLTYKLFTSLKQFAGTGVQFLLVDVVCGEVKSHIAERAASAATQLRAAAREFKEAWRDIEGLDRVLAAAGDLSDPIKAAEDQLERYRAETEFQTLRSSDFVDLDLLLAQYFKPSPPFASSTEKKSEFPDAIALIALEAWGERQKMFVVVVSRDTGWSDFASQSSWLIARRDLRKTLGAFNSQDSFTARAIIAASNSGKAEELSSDIESLVSQHVDSLAPVISAETGHYFEDEFTGATVVEIYPVDIDGVAAVDSDEDEILISFDVLVDVEVEASFVFYVRDEGDDIPFASADASRVVQLKLPFTAAVMRDLEDLRVVDIDLEASSTPHVDFGYVEPDYGDGDYEEEPEGEEEPPGPERL